MGGSKRAPNESRTVSSCRRNLAKWKMKVKISRDLVPIKAHYFFFNGGRFVEFIPAEWFHVWNELISFMWSNLELGCCN